MVRYKMRLSFEKFCAKIAQFCSSAKNPLCKLALFWVSHSKKKLNFLLLIHRVLILIFVFFSCGAAKTNSFLYRY